MLWKRFNQFWNDINLHQKLITMILGTLLLFFFLFSWIVYGNIDAHSRHIYQTELEKNLYSAENVLNTKIERMNSSTLLIAGNHSIENILRGQYYSLYQFYYDLKYQYDSTVAGIRFVNPEILNIDVYMKELNPNLSRSTFHNYSILEHRFPEYDFKTVQGPLWIFDHQCIYLFQKLYNSYNNGDSAIIRFTIDPNSFFSGVISPGTLSDSVFQVKDISDNLLYSETELTEINTGDMFSISQKLSNDWTITLSQSIPMLPLSFLATNRDMIVLLISFIIVMLFLRFLIYQTVVKRISHLNHYVNDVVDNHFSDEINCNDQDEIGNITRNINNMTMRTRQLIEKVYNSQIIQKEAEIKMLQAQINPHFLYNTLSILNWNALKHEDTETSRIITDLSAFYRAALNTSSVTTTIGDEIDFIKKYFSIRMLTCTHIIHMEVFAPDYLLDFELPRIILQPIIENAIDHGIEELPPEQEGKILINVCEHEDEIEICICDNGIGMNETQIQEALKPKTHGYGLYNVNERLKLFFDEIYGIQLQSNDYSGLTVKLHFPKYISLT